jgi:hypothetical protein
MVFRRRRGECGRLNNVAFGWSFKKSLWKFFARVFWLVFLSPVHAFLVGKEAGRGREKFPRGANVEGFPKRDVDSRSIRWMRIAFLRSNARFDGRAGVNVARFFRFFARSSGEDLPFFLALVFFRSQSALLSAVIL